jgi:hypothetical protein
LNQSYNSPFENIRWHYTSTAEIKKIIKTLKNKSSYGYDEIPVKILKISMPYIISPLTYICNEALFQGTFPDRLKYSVIKPIFKTGDVNHLIIGQYLYYHHFLKYLKGLYATDCMNT